MIKSLNIERFRGFSNGGPKVKDLESGVNIIYGENGAGKTTICKAIKALLWPANFKDFSAKVYSVWKNKDNEEVFCALQDATALWESSNASKSSNILIPNEFSSCFVISTDTFDFANDDTDKSISDLISKELSGGINFQNIRASKELEFKPRVFKKLSNELEEAKRKGKQVEQIILGLKNEKDSLPAIRAKIAIEQKLQKQSETILSLIRKAQLEKLISDYNEEIANLNQGALSMKDSDIDNIELYEKRTKTIADDINLKEVELEKLRSQKATLEEEKILTKEELEDFEVIKIELEKTQNSLDKIKEYEKNIKTKKDELVKSLSSQEIYYKIRAYNKHRIEKLAQFLEAYKGLNSKKEDLEKFLDFMSTDNEEILNRLRKDSSIIEELHSYHVKSNIALASLIIFVVLIVLSFIYYPTGRLVAIILGLLSIGVFAFFKYKASQKENEFDNSEYKVNLKSKREVKELLQDLRDRRSSSLQRKVSNKDNYYETQQKISEIDEKISKLKASNAAYFDTSLEAIANVPSIINIWNAIKLNDDELSALREEVREINAKLQEYIEKIKVFFNDDFENNIVFINRKLSKERNKRDEYNLLLKSIETVEKEIATHKKNQSQYKSDIDDICSRVGITKENKNDIYIIFEDRKTYLKLKENLAISSHELKNIESKLVGNVEFQDMSLMELEAKREEIGEELSALSGIDKKEVEILTRIDTFNKSNVFLSAKQEEKEKEENLKDFIDKSLVNIAGGYILDFVESEYKREKEPEILMEANRLFSLFTNGKYSLKFKEDKDFSFFALDEENSKLLNLSELSTGTKAQLVLALRCSYVLSFSKDKSIPLLIDEVLATTDDVRFEAIMSSFFKLAKDGYQIIYLTSQKSVIAQINYLAKKENIRVAIKEISYLDKDLSKIDYGVANVKKIPNLRNVNINERLKLLNVPPILLPINVYNLHIAYLEENVDIVERLLNLNITSFGQLKNLYEKVREKDSIISKEAMDKINAKVKALEIYSNLWSIGRGSKFSKELLEEHATDTFKARLYEIADSVDWMSSKFLYEISPDGSAKIPRFKQQYEKLKEAFERESLIDDREILSKERLHTEFIAKCLNANSNLEKQEVLNIVENIIRKFSVRS
ncbi:MAG: AAA family ATPase [Bdellovibrionota bacterium]